MGDILGSDRSMSVTSEWFNRLLDDVREIMAQIVPHEHSENEISPRGRHVSARIYNSLETGVSNFIECLHTLGVKQTTGGKSLTSVYVEKAKREFENMIQETDKLERIVSEELEMSEVLKDKKARDVKNISRLLKVLQVDLRGTNEAYIKAQNKYENANQQYRNAESVANDARSEANNAEENSDIALAVGLITLFIPVVNIVTAVTYAALKQKAKDCAYKCTCASNERDACRNIVLKSEAEKERIENEIAVKTTEKALREAEKQRELTKYEKLKKYQLAIVNIIEVIRKCYGYLNSVETAFKNFYIEIDDDSYLSEMKEPISLMYKSLNDLVTSSHFSSMFGQPRVLAFRMNCVEPIAQFETTLERQSLRCKRQKVALEYNSDLI